MTPNKPCFPNQNIFKGNILHSVDYKRPNAMFEDKNNVVVGIGNSGIDVAVELSRVSKQVIFHYKTYQVVKIREGEGVKE